MSFWLVPRAASGFRRTVAAAGSLALTRGWRTFARARGLSRRCTLHFKFDGDATLYVRVFGEDGRRAGCCPENDDRGRGSSPGDDKDNSARAAGGGRGSSSFDGSSSGSGSSSGGRDQPLRRRARLEGGTGSTCCRTLVKSEEGPG